MSTASGKFPDRDPDLMYELARDYLGKELEFIDALDGKIAVLLSMASGILGIGAAVIALHATLIRHGQPNGLSGWPLVLLIGGAVVYAWVAWEGGRAYFCRDWNIGPSLDGVWKQLRTTASDDEVKWGVATDSWHDFEANLTAHDLKQDAVLKVFVGAAIETLILVTAIALVAT